MFDAYRDSDEAILNHIHGGRQSSPGSSRENSQRGEFSKPSFRFARKLRRPSAPGESDRAGVQSVMGQNELNFLLRGQPVFHQRQIQILVATVNFVAHDGVAEMREVDADLMFATSARDNSQQGKILFRAGKSPFDPKFRL